MNTRSRLVVILISLVAAFMLVWPNIGVREVEVGFEPGLSEAGQEETIQRIDKHVKLHYPGRYSGEPAETVTNQGHVEKIYLITGSFVQTAFLNELSRIEGVRSDMIRVRPMWVEENLKAKPFKLGLDLQGGMNLLLAGDFEKLKKQIEVRYPEKYINELNAKLITTQDENEKKAIQFELDQIADSLNFSPEKKKEYVQGALEIIRSRIDSTGVSEPLIRLQGEDKIEISLPGVASPEQAKKIIQNTARVEYRLSIAPGEAGVNYSQAAGAWFEEYAKLESDSQREALLSKIEKEINLPLEYGVFVKWAKDPEDIRKLVPRNFLILERQISLSGDDMMPNAYVAFDDERVQHIINFSLTTEGAKKFGEITTKNSGKQLAIMIDDKVRSDPRINEPILGGQASISGDFTSQEAKDLALIIKEGALPVPMTIVEERSVGPSLGYESISKGVTAILYGLIGVAIFMIAYYHVGGVIAVFTLVFNLLFMSAILALMNFTITLPGLAGVVLTLGMIVDANVIIYERIREELARGKSFKLSVTQGFERATLTILDSNLTTMMAAIVLTQFGVGPIKGFAVTLFIGILTSLFTSLYVSRTFFYSLTYDFNVQKFSIGWMRKKSLKEPA